MMLVVTYDVDTSDAAGQKRLRKVAKICERHGMRVQNSVFEVLVDAAHLVILKNELEKLISYVGERKEITIHDLEQLTSSQTTNQIFVMLEAIARKQREKVLTLYYDLIELRESPFGILALLVRQCNQLLQVKDLDRLGKNNGMIAKQMKVPVFVAGKLKDQAKLFSMETLCNMLELCAKTDEAIKTGKISDRVGVELLLIEFSQK